jgi:ABC-type Fe3+/spermidine/putrescine transport system ATPase subunit
VLEIDEIRVQRPGFGVRVGGISLPAGRRLTIIGPSGCGKSTFLRALVGLEPQAQVRGLRWNTQDISAAPPHNRPFGWLPQELGLWPHLSALQHLAFARSRGRWVQPDTDDEALLFEVGLQQRASALPAQLSGGERQRLAFARVMALQPAWAVLDEPFSHLDPVMATELAESFQALAQRLGMGLIQVSHQVQRPAPDDWFWAMENGALTQAGPWAALKTSPATPWIERFVALQS